MNYSLPVFIFFFCSLTQARPPIGRAQREALYRARHTPFELAYDRLKSALFHGEITADLIKKKDLYGNRLFDETDKRIVELQSSISEYKSAAAASGDKLDSSLVASAESQIQNLESLLRISVAKWLEDLVDWHRNGLKMVEGIPSSTSSAKEKSERRAKELVEVADALSLYKKALKYGVNRVPGAAGVAQEYQNILTRLQQAQLKKAPAQKPQGKKSKTVSS